MYKIQAMRIPFVTLLWAFAAVGAVPAADTPGPVTARLADIALYPERSAPATVISLNRSVISARINAMVESLPVKVGEIVEQGRLLAELDCRDYELATEQAEARLEMLKARIELAERRLARTRALQLRQSAAEELLDEREATLAALAGERRAARAGLARARLQRSRCRVKSPFRALISRRLGAVGQTTASGTALFEIIDLERLELSAQIFNRDAGQIQSADALYFEHAERRYPLRLRNVSPAINSETRNREARLLFRDDPALPGAAGKLIWRDPRPHIPAQYLIRRGGELGVFAIENGVARFIAIPAARTGRASPTTLAPTTPLVVEGQFSLLEGDRIDRRE